MTVTAAKLRSILENILDELSPYSDDTPMHVRANTYGMGGDYISIAGEGFISCYDVRAEDDDEDGWEGSE